MEIPDRLATSVGFGAACFRRRIWLAGLLFGASLAASAKDLVLTITSDPPGASLMWNGRKVGTTPYSAKFPGGYFHETTWVLSKVLRESVTITLAAPGYEPDQFDITDGPYDRRNLNGQNFGQFWIITAEKFHRRLNLERPASETAAIERIRVGQYGQLPPAVRVSSGPYGPGVTFQNTTTYQIRVYLRGPVRRFVLILPGFSEFVPLPPGTYEEAVDTFDSKVIPLYGQHVQESGGTYLTSILLTTDR